MIQLRKLVPDLVNIQQVKGKDLDIVDKQNFTYLLTRFLVKI